MYRIINILLLYLEVYMNFTASQDLYQEMCVNHAEEILALQNKNITDNRSLLQSFATFEETSFQKLFDTAQTNGKCAERSKLLREEGNKLYTSKRNEEALLKYTESIKHAPHHQVYQGRELSLALANRSAVLLQLQRHSLALQDMAVAIEAGYPEHLLYKLHERRVKCFKELNQIRSAFKSAEDYVSSLHTANIENSKKEKMRKDFEKQFAQLEEKVKALKDKSENSTFENTYQPMPVIAKCNKNFPAFSDSVTIKYGKGVGRYGVAARDIKLGDILCVETPPFFHLHQDIEDHCSNCMKTCIAPLPSPHTSTLVFCSRECFEAAQSSFHAAEAPFVDTLSRSDMQAMFDFVLY